MNTCVLSSVIGRFQEFGIALCAALSGLALGIQPAVAQTQAWAAETRLISNPAAKAACPDTSRLYEFTLTPGSLTVKTPMGGTKTTPVGADGNISMSWSSVMGIVELVGHVPSRALRVALPAALPGCVYDLKEVAPGEIAGAISWKTSIHLAGGNMQTCGNGNRGSAQVVGNELTLYGGFNFRPDRPMLAVKLAPDGSADLDVRTAFGQSSRARVKVPAGTGPRQVQFVTYTSVCTYHVIPD